MFIHKFTLCFFCLFLVVRRAEAIDVQNLKYLGSTVQKNRERGKEANKSDRQEEVDGKNKF